MSRVRSLESLRSGQPWDILVIGGGATGLGTALDSASRGYRTLLIEASDFAKATSSRSTKLIHGGVRYLAQGNLSLVREALHERALLFQNAPHIVHALSFVVPGYKRWTLPYYGLGLKAYDWLAGSSRVGHSRRVGVDEAVRLLPTLKTDSLRGAIVYQDGQFDDARLAIALARTAQGQGADVLNYVEATGFLFKGKRVIGVAARDVETGETFQLRARGIINATGVFADEVRKLADPDSDPMIRPSQGVHVVLDREFLPGEGALMVPKTDDGRVLFAIPWNGKVIVGTTDTPVPRADLEPTPTEPEIDFLLSHAGRYLCKSPRRSDARSVFAGLRPLLGRTGKHSTASLSREHAVFLSPSGLVTITGGKWTTYRRMAASAVDKAVEYVDLPRRPCVTDSLALQGWTESVERDASGRYGSDSHEVARLAAENPDWADPIHPAYPYLMTEVIWGVRHESARTVEDVLARRTRALMLDARSAAEAAPRVASAMAAELGQGEGWQASQVEAFRALARRWS